MRAGYYDELLGRVIRENSRTSEGFKTINAMHTVTQPGLTTRFAESRIHVPRTELPKGAAGHAVRPGVLLVGYGLPLLFGKLPLLPGGIGIVEGTMAALYDGLGVPDAVTVVVVLAYRLLSFWFPLMIGFPLIPILRGAEGRASSAIADLAPAADISSLEGSANGPPDGIA